jgi:hypothetical protein
MSVRLVSVGDLQKLMFPFFQAFVHAGQWEGALM